MSKKKGKKNPWNTPSQSSGSEPEIIRTETTGGSSAEERDDEIARGSGKESDRGFEGRGSIGPIGGRFGGDERGREGKDDADV